MMIIWKLSGELSELFCAVLCDTVVNCRMHTDVVSKTLSQSCGRKTK